MTLNDIDVLLHYYCNVGRHPRLEEAPGIQKTINSFVAEKILKANGFGGFEVTDRGRALVQMLRNVKYPECKWFDPTTGEVVEL